MSRSLLRGREGMEPEGRRREERGGEGEGRGEVTASIIPTMPLTLGLD